LASYEVHFGYVEAGEKKEALVKLRACPRCARKLVDARGGNALETCGASGEEDRSVADNDSDEDLRGDGSRKRRRREKQDSERSEDAEDEDAQHRKCFANMFA
jgi:protein FRA10AC1